MSQIIIALTGPKGCGKSTAADFFIKNGFQKHYFAKPLKEMIKCLGLTEEHVNGSTEIKESPCEELCGQTPRWAMQTIGTQWGRDLIHPDLWVNAWKNTLPNSNVVCDDLRFPNELKTLKEKKGFIINISRPGFKLDSSHESESYEFKADFYVENNGSKEQLFEKLEYVLRQIYIATGQNMSISNKNILERFKFFIKKNLGQLFK